MTTRAELKTESRNRILQAAGTRLRVEGLAGAGIADVMKDAGLTHGAFYAHFANKSELSAAALRHALLENRKRWIGEPRPETWRQRLQRLASRYLTKRHRDHPAEGCALAALATESGRGDEPMRLHARSLVNAAGLYATHVAHSIAGLAPAAIPAPHWARGHYFACTGRSPFARLIYPMPDDAGLGIHLTLDLGGQMRFGPDVQWLARAEPDAEDYTVDAALADGFAASIRRFWPALPDGALQPAYAGIRPKIAGPGEPAADFRIDGPTQHGLPGLVNLFGIESPGLTACLAIAEQVQALLGG